MGILGNAFSGWHLLLLLAVVLLLFGAAKLPSLAKSVGQSVRILRAETQDHPAVEGATQTESGHEQPGGKRPDSPEHP